ncbi:MAG: hypothetical protein ACLQFX_08705 [Acidimicrobiales bacterium]
MHAHTGRVEVAADTERRDGAKLLGFESLELQAGGERLCGNDGFGFPDSPRAGCSKHAAVEVRED